MALERREHRQRGGIDRGGHGVRGGDDLRQPEAPRRRRQLVQLFEVLRERGQVAGAGGRHLGVQRRVGGGVVVADQRHLPQNL